MSTFNIKQLEDHARDVDPDLRYMALEDFRKQLDNPKIQVRNVSSFIPILFKLLNDSTTEVQNQAVRSFAPLVRHISDEDTLNVVIQLYEAVLKSANGSKFSTSVPNLALRSVFTHSHSRFSKSLSRSIVDALLPRLLASTTPATIDNIEITIDLIKTLGFVLSPPELAGLISSLIKFAYRESGIISKRSIVAVDYAFDYISSMTQEDSSKQIQFYDKVVNDVMAGRHLASNNDASKNTQFTLLRVILSKARQSKHEVLSEASSQIIFSQICADLKLEDMSEVDPEDLDIDVLVQENLAREESLITFASLVGCVPYDLFLQKFASTAVSAITAFITYDPLHYDESDDEDGNDESDIEFSDEEESADLYENTEENDGLASHLRLQSILLLKHIVDNFSVSLPLFFQEGVLELVIKAISDRSDIVSNEAISASIDILYAIKKATAVRSRANSDVSMATENGASGTSFGRMFTDLPPLLETQVFDTLLTAKNIPRVSTCISLIESLIDVLLRFLSDKFLLKLLERLYAFNFTLSSNLDFIKLYKKIFTVYSLEEIPQVLFTLIFDDLVSSLKEPKTYHSFISDILAVCNALFKQASDHPEIEALIDSNLYHPIADKINMKEYSSDVRQNLISSLTELIIHVGLSEANLHHAIEIYKESLKYEVTVSSTINGLIAICNHKPQMFNSPELCTLVVEKLNSFLASSDSSLYVNSFVLLDAIFVNTHFQGEREDLKSLSDNIFDLLRETQDTNLINRAVRILGHTLNFFTPDGAYFQKLVTQVINVKWMDEDDVDLKSFEYLIKQISSKSSLSGSELYDIGLRHLNLKNFLSAKVMAIITLDSHLDDMVKQSENELVAYSQDSSVKIPIDRIVYDIQYLGCVASETSLSKVTFEDFFTIVSTSPNEHLNLAAARAMGLSIRKSMDLYLPILLDHYRSADQRDDNKEALVLVAIKQVMRGEIDQNKQASLAQIWESVLEVIKGKTGELEHKDVAELKLAGSILAKICLRDRSHEYENKLMSVLWTESASKTQNDFIIYTAVVIIKELINNPEDGSFNLQLVEGALRYLEKPNLEIKQAIVSTLLTGIHNKCLADRVFLDEVILPRIYDELSAKEEFKKVIPMGPYKYVVDEGLEVRKLSYELINTIINIDNDRVKENHKSVNQVRMFEVLVAKGLFDSENDIVNMTVINLRQLIENDENVLRGISNQQEMIEALGKIMNKKMRAKASTQEIESHEDTLRAVIRLLKIMNAIYSHGNAVTVEWNAYYHEIRNKHHLLFSAVEI